ncbi:hypothetical protein GCK72_002888 [Caenorhabditis remanei]|uniref:Uncharacterized protein n=1 Tax=Caenorhabditis remanei TaxID=31234 RepID=A0A6A5HX84_CAERE|nr:hypothetical protein GCK72_002888 [Caenorhabditis remanei]KAF1771063.1 hypothetical protein GCK72_002888 [Caenorhabditis remanei]
MIIPPTFESYILAFLPYDEPDCVILQNILDIKYDLKTLDWESGIPGNVYSILDSIVEELEIKILKTDYPTRDWRRMLMAFGQRLFEFRENEPLLPIFDKVLKKPARSMRKIAFSNV